MSQSVNNSIWHVHPSQQVLISRVVADGIKLSKPTDLRQSAISALEISFQPFKRFVLVAQRHTDTGDILSICFLACVFIFKFLDQGDRFASFPRRRVNIPQIADGDARSFRKRYSL